jgi:glutamate carboxypeptidase
VNAAVAAAGLAVDLAALNGRWSDVTINVGVLQGGDRPNVVPAQASLVADVRAVTTESFDQAIAAVRALADRPAVAGAEVRVSLENPAPPWVPDAASERVARAAGAVRLGLDLGFARTGGTADANLLAAHGIAVLDGLGPIGGDDHSTTEWLDLHSVVPRTTLLAGLMVELADLSR